MILEGMEDKNIEEFSRILESRKKLKIRQIQKFQIDYILFIFMHRESYV